MTRADRLALHYIRAAELVAICLVQRGRTVGLLATHDPDKRAREVRCAGGTVLATWWCSGEAAACVILEVAEARWPKADAREIMAELPQLARSICIGLTDDAVVRQRAAAVVADIEARVKAMQAAGQLRALNDEYREARISAAARGERALPYSAYLDRYKLGLLDEVARLAR